MKTLRIVLFSFLLFSLKTFAAATLDRVAAVVVDEPILQSEVETLRKAITQSQAMREAYKLSPALVTFDAVLNRMIEEKIVKVSLKELDINVSDAEVETQINAIAKQNNITRKQLDDSLAREGLSPDEYKKNIRGQLERRNLFDRELRRGGGITEAELRNMYDRLAPVEIKVSTSALKNTLQSRKIVEAMIKDVKDGKKKFQDAMTEYGAESLDWVTVDSIDPKFGKLSNAMPGTIIGPVLIKNNLQLLFIEGNRRGSPEGFEKAKNELMMKAQNEDFERRFQSWLDRKKSELNIVVNKL